MLNKEVFEKFGSEQWIIEENLCYLLQKICREVRSFKPI